LISFSNQTLCFHRGFSNQTYTSMGCKRIYRKRKTPMCQKLI
jgi:hypothetical protein